jgi:hypothetical protein
MAKKPRMGSDPFQKKDPLDWIAKTGDETAGETASKQGPRSNLDNQSKPGKSSKPVPQNPPGKPSKSRKQELPDPPSPPENPRKQPKPTRGSTTSKGLRPGWTRATFIVREETVQQLKAVAYWDRKDLKRVVDEAFTSYLDGREVNPIPSD